MARPTTIHVCSSCGHSTPRWHGQCPGCDEWNTLVEEVVRPAAAGRGGARGAARAG
ncbi:MAG: DNA repair protein RadA, partial [Actinomycetota bacterium]|nr:DNA repair protein RadA [Actinomycetota bacterium]